MLEAPPLHGGVRDSAVTPQFGPPAQVGGGGTQGVNEYFKFHVKDTGVHFKEKCGRYLVT